MLRTLGLLTWGASGWHRAPGMAAIPRQHGSLTPTELVEGWLARYSAASRAAYRQALRHWCQWVGDFGLGVAVLAAGSRSADARLSTVLRWYRTVLANEDRSAAKIRQHLAALRSLGAYRDDGGRYLDAEAERAAGEWLAGRDWQKVVAYTSPRHSAILSERTVARMLALTNDPRDRAIVALMLYHRLMPDRVSQLDYDDRSDWQLDSSDELSLEEKEESRPSWERNLGRQLQKSVRQVEWESQTGWPAIGRFPLRDVIRGPLEGWLEERGNVPGALFTNRDRAGKGQRLTPRSVNRIVHDAGARIGRPDLSPRLLRRAGQPSRRRVGRRVEGIISRRKAEWRVTLADFDGQAKWDWEWGDFIRALSLEAGRDKLSALAPDADPPWHERPPWAWRDPAVQLGFANEMTRTANALVERGSRTAEEWEQLMALLAAQVAGFAVPEQHPVAPSAEPPPQRRRGRRYRY